MRIAINFEDSQNNYGYGNGYGNGDGYGDVDGNGY